VLATHAALRGLLSVPPGGWSAAFEAEFGAWRVAHPGLPCLLAGMVGSRQGWAEAPYCPCPAGPADIARRLLWLESGCLAIVPGLCTQADGVPDVLRGEEVQVVGALQVLDDPAGDHTLVLPGTHSKWVQVRGGQIAGFATHMTGEAYALLRQQSILARMLPADDGEDAFDGAAFDDGVAQAARPGGLLHHVFSVRTLALFDRAGGAALASRLSGLLIGEELRAQALAPGGAVTVIASPALALRYQRALAVRGHVARLAPADAGWLGMLAVARAAGLVAAPGTLAG
jgi:2-dehydro-3-deoxygalactonokinase